MPDHRGFSVLSVRPIVLSAVPFERFLSPRFPGHPRAGPSAAEVVLAVMAWAAKMERLAINERISAARERVESEGGSWGRPRKIDHRAREKMLAMKTTGKSIREIAMAMKIPKSTVARVVSRKYPTGTAPPAP